MVYRQRKRRRPKPRTAHLRPRRAQSPGQYVLREASPRDLDALHRLSAHLNSVNLPDDRESLEAAIDRSRKSFGARVPPLEREYIFVLEDEERILGTSMLIAQHGTSDAPHIYFDVITDERYSSTLDRHFSHTCLRLGFNYRGPTEIGGLVLDPACRGLGLGKQLSFVRFLFIAMYKERFRPWVIAELMPPLLPDGRSELWEYLGRVFTGLNYQEADKLSRSNKEFITSLFPQTPLYASLLPLHVQSLIGKVGEETRGVKSMLESIGFEYSERIDPFDGGPHFSAQTQDVLLIQQARSTPLSRSALPEGAGAKVLAGKGNREGPCTFRATQTNAAIEDGALLLPSDARSRLKVKTDDLVWTIPL